MTGNKCKVSLPTYKIPSLSNEDKLWFSNLCQKHKIPTLQKNDEEVLLAYTYLAIFGEFREAATNKEIPLGKLVSLFLILSYLLNRVQKVTWDQLSKFGSPPHLCIRCISNFFILIEI